MHSGLLYTRPWSETDHSAACIRVSGLLRIHVKGTVHPSLLATPMGVMLDLHSAAWLF